MVGTAVITRKETRGHYSNLLCRSNMSVILPKSDRGSRKYTKLQAAKILLDPSHFNSISIYLYVVVIYIHPQVTKCSFSTPVRRTLQGKIEKLKRTNRIAEA